MSHRLDDDPPTDCGRHGVQEHRGKEPVREAQLDRCRAEAFHLLPDGTLAGSTHSVGRGFLSVWTTARR